LHEEGFQSERFDRISAFEKQIAIVPSSAKTGEGLPELLVLLTGLSQRFLSGKLEISPESPGKGTVLEVKEERGLGTTIDVILYQGNVKRGDKIAIGGKNGVILSTVRAILKPKPLDEIRDPKFRFNHIKEVYAASGIKVAAPKIGEALSGSHFYVIPHEKESSIIEDIEKELEEIAVKKEDLGVIVKTDTIGTLEAMVKILEENSIPVRLANVGEVSKRDVIEAASVKEKEADEFGIKIIENDIIYKIIEDYEEWLKDLREAEKKEELSLLVRPSRIRLIPGTVFRQNKPAIIGVEVLEGSIKPKYKLLNSKGDLIGELRGIQDQGENLSLAEKGREVAASIDGPTIGRQVREGEILLTQVPESHAKLLMKKYRHEISTGEVEVLDEIKAIMRKTNPLWGM
jgi:translation initiation factor 5B